MKSAENIRDLVKKAAMDSNPEVNSVVLKGLLEELDKSYGMDSAAAQPDLRRKIMKSRITKLAAAAIIIMAILVGINQFGGSIDGASVLYAQVRESIEKKPWICAKQTVLEGDKTFGGEEWFSIESKIIVEIVDDGRIKYSDFKHKRRYEYQPMSGTITISPIKEAALFFEAKTVLGLLEKLIETQKGAVLSRTLVEQNGKTLDIWEVARSEDTGNEKKMKLFINTNEYLPIIAEVTYTDTTGKTIYRGTIDFEYPENGPKNIYEIGVPEDAKVVYLEDPSLELLGVAVEYDKRRRQLGDFRAVTIYGNKIKPQFTIFEYLPSKNQRRHSISRGIADYDSKSLDELVETLFSGGWLPLLDAASEVFPEGYLPNNIVLLEPKMVALFSDYSVGKWNFLTSDEPELLNKLGFELKTYPKTGVYVR
ncbi:MAG: hypothetical protein ACYTBJ_06905 [Planctomycetota bacterium]|jgi:hypothetical protein